MKRFIVDWALNEEAAQKFVTFVDANPDDQIKIYLNSAGGHVSCTRIMLEIINSEPDRFELYAIERIYSSALTLFFNAKCKRHIDDFTYGMCHLTACEMTMMVNGQPRYDGDAAFLKFSKEKKDGLADLLTSMGVSSKDKSDIMKGKEVFFSHEQLIQFMKYQDVLRLQEPTKEGI